MASFGLPNFEAAVDENKLWGVEIHKRPKVDFTLVSIESAKIPLDGEQLSKVEVISENMSQVKAKSGPKNREYKSLVIDCYQTNFIHGLIKESELTKKKSLFKVTGTGYPLPTIGKIKG